MPLEDKISAAESSGNIYAKNPRSSATGPHQFIAGTWLSLVKKYRPDVMQGRSVNEVLALRTNPELSTEMSRHYNAENGAYLRARGFEPTDENVYLAHFAGPKGAADLLANPDAPARSILSADAIEANPYLKDWRASDVTRWAGGKMGWRPMIASTVARGTPSAASGATPDALASYTAAPAATKPKEHDAVLPFLMELLGSAGGTAGAAGAAGATPALGANMFGDGLLAQLFGGSGGAQPEPAAPAQMGAQPNQLMPMRPVDMSGLQAMIARRPRLGAPAGGMQ